MRGSMTVSAVLAVAMLAIGCGQTSATAPSSVAPAAVGPVSSGLVTPRGPSPPPIEPLLARLNLVTNHLTSANHQLDLFLVPNPPPIVPPNPLFLQNALDFYLKANGVLSTIASPNPPPIAPQWTDALNGIIGEANTTLSLLHADCDGCQPDGPPIFQDLIAQANQTKSLATALLPQPPPI